MANSIWRMLVTPWRGKTFGLPKKVTATPAKPSASPHSEPPVVFIPLATPEPLGKQQWMDNFAVDAADQSWSRQITAGRALLAWTEWDLSEATGFEISDSEVKHYEQDGWSSHRKMVAVKLRAALEAAGIRFLTDGAFGVGVQRCRPMQEKRNFGRPPEEGRKRTLCIDGYYAIEMEYEYSFLRWPGGLYPVGEHYGDCKCAVINTARGWCVTGGAGLVVTLFDGGLPHHRDPVNRDRVTSYLVSHPLDSKKVLWIETIWREEYEPEDSDFVTVVSGREIFKLNVRAPTWTKVG